mmetsp:Transcript_67281/g.186404  ORF Transcript_67281/g.186404 Transcript_67281/m.186404 type:complete len:274 (+) Transcript_67281:656-1477(+)
MPPVSMTVGSKIGEFLLTASRGQDSPRWPCCEMSVGSKLLTLGVFFSRTGKGLQEAVPSAFEGRWPPTWLVPRTTEVLVATESRHPVLHSKGGGPPVDFVAALSSTLAAWPSAGTLQRATPAEVVLSVCTTGALSTGVATEPASPGSRPSPGIAGGKNEKAPPLNACDAGVPGSGVWGDTSRLSISMLVLTAEGPEAVEAALLMGSPLSSSFSLSCSCSFSSSSSCLCVCFPLFWCLCLCSCSCCFRAVSTCHVVKLGSAFPSSSSCSSSSDS